MTDEALANDVTVQVDGADLPQDVQGLLVSAYVEDSRALPDAFELRFRDPDRVVITKAGLEVGAPAKLGVRTAADNATTWLVEGEVTALEVEVDGLGSWTVVRGYDQSHRLMRGRVVKDYRDKSIADIVREVAGRAGLQVGSVDSGPALKEVVQPNVSDWDFLCRLAGDVGREMSVTEGRLNFREPTKAADGTPVELDMDVDLVRFRAAVTAAEQVDEVQVRAWDPATKKALVGKAAATTTTSTQISLTPKKVLDPFGGTKVLTVTDAAYATDQQQVDSLAKSLAAQVSSTFAEIEAVVRGNPSLRSGKAVRLVGVDEPFEGTYVVTTSRHRFDPEDGYQTWITVSGQQDRSLLGLSGARRSRLGVVPGLVPGVVTDAQDPDKLGRVKVTLPWMDDQFVTDWARTLQLGGKQGGGIVLPEVNDEVLVGFEQGRLERPFVLGGLYNGVDKPKEGDVPDVDGSSGEISRRAFSSRSGHRLELFDAANGANGLRLSTGDGKYVVNLDKQGGSVAIASDGTVVVDGKGDVSVTAGGNLTIQAKGNLELKAGGNLTAEANGNVDISAKANATVKGEAKAALTSSAQVSASGAMAELKGSATTIISGGIVKIN